jgi:hypothetical protein
MYLTSTGDIIMRIIGAIIVALLSVVSIEAGQGMDPNPLEAVSAIPAKKPMQEEIVQKDISEVTAPAEEAVAVIAEPKEVKHPEVIAEGDEPQTDKTPEVIAEGDEPQTDNAPEVIAETKVAVTEKQQLKTIEEVAETAAANTSEVSEGTENTASRKHRFGVFAAIGDGDGSIESVAFGLDYHPKATWFEGGDWGLVSYFELLVGYWEADEGHTGVTSLHEGGLTCYLRHIRSGNISTALRPYIDAGVGLHYVTEDEIEGKELGKQWLAGSNVGCGIVIGESERVDIGIRLRHLSNGGIEEINWGINHLMLRTAIRF